MHFSLLFIFIYLLPFSISYGRLYVCRRPFMYRRIKFQEAPSPCPSYCFGSATAMRGQASFGTRPGNSTLPRAHNYCTPLLRGIYVFACPMLKYCAVGNYNWNVSLSKDWIRKKVYAPKYYVVQSFWWCKNLNFF